MLLHDDVIAEYRDFATYAAGDSPCFEEWALAVAQDAEVLAWLGTLPPIKRQPNLVLAAARWHGAPAPGPYAGLRRVLLEREPEVRATIMSRATQTNEAGRLATLVPVLGLVEGPLALVEVGASAGLCLFPEGGWKLSSSSDNSWASKIALCQHIARTVLKVDLPDPNRHEKEHVRWQVEGSGYWAYSDQMQRGVPVGSRFYPRGVTAVLWLDESPSASR